MGLDPVRLMIVASIVNLVVSAVANLAANLAMTGADAVRTADLIIGTAVFLLAGATLLVAMRFRATRNRDKTAETAEITNTAANADDTK